jgi:potassium channel subfamily K
MDQVTENLEQQWSYFQSLYFSYTSLLTIGYGDLFPVSNAGKPFFVFWSLLAVPSLTILISNMGDTIVKGVRDLTLWIGTVTVLPGERGVRSSAKMTIQRVSCRPFPSLSPNFYGLKQLTYLTFTTHHSKTPNN